MASSVSGEADETLEAQMRTCLAGRGGEISARNRAAKLAETYLEADEAGRQNFLRTLAGFDSDPDAVAAAYARVTAAEDPAERATAKAALRQALEPPRLRLLTQFAWIPDGCKFLVDLRADLLKVRATDKMLTAWTPMCEGSWHRGSTSASWTCGGLTGTVLRCCWRNWLHMKRSMPSVPGAI